MKNEDKEKLKVFKQLLLISKERMGYFSKLNNWFFDIDENILFGAELFTEFSLKELKKELNDALDKQEVKK